MQLIIISIIKGKIEFFGFFLFRHSDLGSQKNFFFFFRNVKHLPRKNAFKENMCDRGRYPPNLLTLKLNSQFTVRAPPPIQLGIVWDVFMAVDNAFNTMNQM